MILSHNSINVKLSCANPRKTTYRHVDVRSYRPHYRFSGAFSADQKKRSGTRSTEHPYIAKLRLLAIYRAWPARISAKLLAVKDKSFLLNYPMGGRPI